MSIVGTWDPTLSTVRDVVRLTVGDTGLDSMPWLLGDTTYDALIVQYTVNQCIGKVARSLATRFAQEPDAMKDEGGGVSHWVSRIKTWQKLADEYDPVAQANETVGTGFGYLTTQMTIPPVQSRATLQALGIGMPGYRGGPF